MNEELMRRAEEAIKNEDEVCFDVAANVGQIFSNVKHMTWFKEAVAEELAGVCAGCGMTDGHVSGCSADPADRLG